MNMNDKHAREIAGRWGQAATSEPLLAFAKTGLVEDRKRLLEAIGSLCVFVKHPEELKQLMKYVQSPCASEIAARREGWDVENDEIHHVHDYERKVSYKSWTDCCEGEDIIVENAVAD
jgi:hypothetical protein